MQAVRTDKGEGDALGHRRYVPFIVKPSRPVQKVLTALIAHLRSVFLPSNFTPFSSLQNLLHLHEHGKNSMSRVQKDIFS